MVASKERTMRQKSFTYEPNSAIVVASANPQEKFRFRNLISLKLNVWEYHVVQIEKYTVGKPVPDQAQYTAGGRQKSDATKIITNECIVTYHGIGMRLQMPLKFVNRFVTRL